MNHEGDMSGLDNFEVTNLHAELDQEPSEITHARAEVEQIADKLGNPVDEAIKETVVAFLASDIPTSGSCEGHLDRGTPYPWVEVYAPAPEGWKESEQKQNEWRQANQALRSTMQGLLDEFYRNQTFDTESRLRMADIGAFGAYRIQGPTESTGDERPIEAGLTRHRQEINNFARFLLSKKRESS